MREGEGPENVTRILDAVAAGEAGASERLLPLVYESLRELAKYRMVREPAGTLQATALVHEAYLRLVGGEDGGAAKGWENRRHFFGAAAEAMRRILIERARERATIKRGGGRRRIDLDAVDVANEPEAEDLLRLDSALERLAAIDARKAEIVRLRYFAGLTIEEAALALEMGPTMVKAEWKFARAWLLAEVGRDAAG